MKPLREINPDNYEYVSAGPQNLPDDGGKVDDVLVFHGTRGEDNDMPYLWAAAWITAVEEASDHPFQASLTGKPGTCGKCGMVYHRTQKGVWSARISSFDPYTEPKCRWMRKKPLWKRLGNLCPCAFDGSKDHTMYCIEGKGYEEEGFPKDYTPSTAK